MGLSKSGSIYFGITFVAGKKRVPKPAHGKTHVRSVLIAGVGYQSTVLEELEAFLARQSEGFGTLPRSEDAQLADQPPLDPGNDDTHEDRRDESNQPGELSTWPRSQKTLTEPFGSVVILRDGRTAAASR